jgi:excinuclease UvrABC nuclease subunit
MVPPEPLTIAPADGTASPHQGPAVFLIWPRQAQPYLGRTKVFRRRITRLIEKWNLVEVAERIEYWPVASRLEQWLLSYSLAKRHFPDSYERVLRLPKPPYVKLIQANEFPRTQVSTRLSGAHNLFFGPFVNRHSAELFESQFLDLFQLRRCQEDLVPSPDHPGCIYGEMLKCLRPCQGVVTMDEYSSEARRVADFLHTRGRNLLDTTAAARDRASAALEFEQAAQQHARSERILQIVRSAGDLACNTANLHGVAITAAVPPQTVLLWFIREGCWLAPTSFSVAPVTGKPVSMDARLRELTTTLESPHATLALRQDHLALLSKWYYSSWRDGEWLSFDEWESIPYRKLVNAIARVAAGRSDSLKS